MFYSGMPAASIEKNITARLERGVGQASGAARLESRSIVGVSIVRDYFRSNVDPNGALTEVNSLAGGDTRRCRRARLPPVVLPYDPTSDHARLPGGPGQRRRRPRRPSSTSAATRSAP